MCEITIFYIIFVFDIIKMTQSYITLEICLEIIHCYGNVKTKKKSKITPKNQTAQPASSIQSSN